jgi:hypothetical protein
VYIIFTHSHPTASIVYSAKSLCICIWPNMSVLASIPTHKHGQKWPLRRLKVNFVKTTEKCNRDVLIITAVNNMTTEFYHCDPKV